MARRNASTEPAFGSDSFLDVTANLVGVLIILIVLIGLRVAQAPPRAAAVDAEVERRLTAMKNGLAELNLERLELERRWMTLQQGLSAKHAALARLSAGHSPPTAAVPALNDQLQHQRNGLRVHLADLEAAQARLVSLSEEFERAKAARDETARTLEHRSPVSQRVEAEELHLELQSGRVAFIDLATLMQRAKGNWPAMESELKTRSRATAEVGPVNGFRLRFTMAREEMPFSQSLLYGNGSFRARLVEWQLNPSQDRRGVPIDAALEPESQFQTVLARHSPNKYAVTIWTYSDSFSAFRRLRDQLADRGYQVAARPLPVGVPIRGSVYGSRSFTQ